MRLFAQCLEDCITCDALNMIFCKWDGNCTFQRGFSFSNPDQSNCGTVFVGETDFETDVLIQYMIKINLDVPN